MVTINTAVHDKTEQHDKSAITAVAMIMVVHMILQQLRTNNQLLVLQKPFS